MKPEGDASRLRSPGLTWLGIAISLLALGAVVWWALEQPAPRFPDEAGEWLALAGAVALYGANMAIRGERWRLLLRQGGAEPRRRDCLGLTLVGYATNNVLPARAGDLLRILMMAPRARTSRREVTGTLLSERVLDIVVLGALLVILAPAVGGGIELPPVPAWAWVVLGVVLALVLVGLGWGVRRHPERLRSMREYIRPVFRSLRELRGRHGAAMLAFSLLVWLIEACAWWAAAAAVGLDISVPEALYVIALTAIFLLIPSGPGYAGTADAAILLGARAIGASGSLALSWLIMIRFVVMVPVTIAGLLVLVLGYGGMGLLRRLEREAWPRPRGIAEPGPEVRQSE